MNRRRALLVGGFFVMAPVLAAGQGTSMTLGGYVDAYFAWDVGRPSSGARTFTTQARRHAEFAINLAYIDLELTGDFVRGRVALQAGTAVMAGDELFGSTSGDAGHSVIERHLQEAVVGLRLGDRTWVDAGVFLSHTGSEKWIPRENLTYTRSLVADLSPHRLAGVKLTREVLPTVSAAAVLVNGWGSVTETNVDKSVGLRADWRLTRRLALAYYNLIGNEAPDSVAVETRYYNGLTGTYAGSELTIAATLDGGRQNTPAGTLSWWGAALVARLQVMERWAASARLETFRDPERVVAQSVAPFEVWGASVGLDYRHADGVAWRSEFRNLRASKPLFAQYDAVNGLSQFNYVFVTSLALTL